MSEDPAASVRSARPLYVLTILVGSFLLFLVQPMVARMALPRLGGAPAVWNSAMLVYQALLLGGYAYAHALGRLRLKVGALVHIAVLLAASLWLPIGLFAFAMPPDAEPAVWVPWLLGASIGPLFFAVSAQAPLMQRWFAAREPAGNPYALYAASNIGSFAGLLAYPLLVEPLMTLHQQSWLWSAGYVVLILLVAACAWLLPRGLTRAESVPTSEPVGLNRWLLWVALAFVPSGLMLATSTFLTTDIVAVPLLWVIPLGLYLLSFTVAFADRRGVADVLTKFAPITVLMFGGVMIAGHQQLPYLTALMSLALLFMVAVALHTRMYQLRPAADRLTGFYLAMSIGGALGGVFAGLIAPVVFDWTYEYPILILAAGALVPQAFLLPIIERLWRGTPSGHRVRVAIVAALVVLLVFVGITNPGELLGKQHENIAFLAVAFVGIAVVGVRLPFMIVLAGALFLFGGYRALETSWAGDQRVRSYFGVYTISDYANVRTLAHGTTLHGLELTGTPEREIEPTTYYVRHSGVGEAMRAAPLLYGDGARIGVVGLGTGTLACYAKPGQRWTFFEIDPAVVGIARDSGKFNFLPRCLPNPNIVLGDARMQIAASPPHSFDILALDAFSSDAVPMHLMTTEAFETYARALAPRGVLLVHISNRFLNLQPVVAAAAEKGRWHASMLQHVPSPEEGESASVSDWIALSRDPATLVQLTLQDGRWQPLEPKPGFYPWTDDYATILPVVRSLQ